MGAMSDLDIMVREGDRTVEDFMARGFSREMSEAMAEIVASTEDRGLASVAAPGVMVDYPQGD